jgi:hypothetical protein
MDSNDKNRGFSVPTNKQKTETLKQIKEEDQSDNSIINYNSNDIESQNEYREKKTIISEIPNPHALRERIAKSSAIFSEKEFSHLDKARTKTKRLLSFYNGRPTTSEAIERITDPFYVCEKTIKAANMISIDAVKTSSNIIQQINTLEIKTFTSMFMTILQIINSIIRYTIVQFPYCIRVLGIIYGPIIICIIGIMSIFSIYMLIEVKNYTHKK